MSVAKQVYELYGLKKKKKNVINYVHVTDLIRFLFYSNKNMYYSYTPVFLVICKQIDKTLNFVHNIKAFWVTVFKFRNRQCFCCNYLKKLYTSHYIVFFFIVHAWLPHSGLFHFSYPILANKNLFQTWIFLESENILLFLLSISTISYPSK